MATGGNIRPKPKTIQDPISREVIWDSSKKFKDYRLTTDRYIKSIDELSDDDLQWAIKHFVNRSNKKFHLKNVRERNQSENAFLNDINTQANLMYKDLIKNVVVMCFNKHGSTSAWKSHAAKCGITINPLTFSRATTSTYGTIHIHHLLLCIIASGLNIVDVASSVEYLSFNPDIHLKLTPKVKIIKPKKEPGSKRVRAKGFILQSNPSL